MENFQIVVTDNRTIVVLADSKRYGKNAIVYEGHTFMQCCDYIRRVTRKNHFKMKAYSCTRTFTDTEGRTMPWIMDVVF
jgi:hypothetical protein